MNKKVVSALLFGSLVFATGTFTACSDYDEDIDSLNERVDAVEKSIAGLQASIEAGNVITNVESTDNGVKVTLSDGTSFELTNGKDGAAGAPGSVVTIGDNGNWFIDGVDTGKPSRGEKGEQGEQGVQGPQGEQGIQGEQGPQGEQGIQGEQGESGDYAGKGNPGDYYYPAEDGLWHKYVYDAATGKYADSGETAGAWKSAEGGVTAVYDTTTGLLTLANVVVDGVINQTVTIEMYAELKSLAVIPETLDEVSKLPVFNFYNIMKDEQVVGSTNAIARFRLNPSNANVDEKLISWSLIDREVSTTGSRAIGDNENSLMSIYGTPERKADELYVTMQSNKSWESVGGEMPIVALKATNKYNEEEIVSDYLTVGIENLNRFSIVNLIPTDTVFDATLSPNYKLRSDRPDPDQYCDFQLNADQSLDLNKVVNTLAEELNVTTLEALKVNGLSYRFSKPGKYTPHNDDTNQQEFITLSEDGVVTPNMDEFGPGVIGRTPIVYVEAILNNVTIASGYLKIDIVEKSDLKMKEYYVEVGELEYTDLVASNPVGVFGWDRMNSEVYKDINLSREGFERHYTGVVPGQELGELLDHFDPANVDQTSDVAVLRIDPAYIAVEGKEGEVRTATILFNSDEPYNYPNIAIHFNYSIKHTHVFPAFNDDYDDPVDGAMLVKGYLNTVTGNWEYEQFATEQFEDYLQNYTEPNNHNILKIDIPYAEAHNVRLSGSNVHDQKVELNSAIYKQIVNDVPAQVVSEMINGEKCVKDYTIRFVNPFRLELIGTVSLETLKEADVDDLKNYLQIKDTEGNLLYDGTQLAKGLTPFTTKAADYGLNKSTLSLKFIGRFGAEFGGNLTLTEDGVISWYNDGGDLQNQLRAQFDVEATIENIAVLSLTTNHYGSVDGKGELGEIIVKPSAATAE